MPVFSRRSSDHSIDGCSIIDEQLVVRGELSTAGAIRVDGRVEATTSDATHRAGTLIVGAGGAVVGDVEAREVVVAGTIEGSIVAGARVEVQAGGAVHGDIRARAIALHEGGIVRGHVSVDTTVTSPEPSQLSIGSISKGALRSG